ncbi:hypothetical protein ATCC90586_011713 [Pythium insidiosum]|nr:hypothetical protein ATCC90586_011713 [Pythium insidiosum]
MAYADRYPEYRKRTYIAFERRVKMLQQGFNPVRQPDAAKCWDDHCKRRLKEIVEQADSVSQGLRNAVFELGFTISFVRARWTDQGGQLARDESQDAEDAAGLRSEPQEGWQDTERTYVPEPVTDAEFSDGEALRNDDDDDDMEEPEAPPTEEDVESAETS